MKIQKKLLMVSLCLCILSVGIYSKSVFKISNEKNIKAVVISKNQVPSNKTMVIETENPWG